MTSLIVHAWEQWKNMINGENLWEPVITMETTAWKPLGTSENIITGNM